MFDPGSSGNKKPQQVFAGCALIALGLLILLPSGLCTAIMGYGVLAEGLGSDFEGLYLLIISLVSAAVGAALFYAGLRARK